jgi:tetratricopeptide (TPR) repeat protein
VRRYGERAEAAIAELVAQALVNKGVTLANAGNSEAALVADEEVVRRYGERAEAPIAAQVARALFNKGVALANAGNSEEALAAWDEVVRRYGARTETAIAELVAMALCYKGIALATASKTNQKMVLYDKVARRYGKRSEAAVAEQVAEAAHQLIQAMRKGSATIREKAIRILGIYCLAHPQAVDDVIHALSDEDDAVRSAAVGVAHPFRGAGDALRRSSGSPPRRTHPTCRVLQAVYDGGLVPSPAAGRGSRRSRGHASGR